MESEASGSTNTILTKLGKLRQWISFSHFGHSQLSLHSSSLAHKQASGVENALSTILTLESTSASAQKSTSSGKDHFMQQASSLNGMTLMLHLSTFLKRIYPKCMSLGKCYRFSLGLKTLRVDIGSTLSMCQTKMVVSRLVLTLRETFQNSCCKSLQQVSIQDEARQWSSKQSVFNRLQYVIMHSSANEQTTDIRHRQKSEAR